MDHLEKILLDKTALHERIPADPLNAHDMQAIKNNLFKNIATADNILTKIEPNIIYNSIPGAIIASPSRVDSTFSQDYFFNWIRDAAIVMNELAYLYENNADEQERNYLFQCFINYIHWNKIAQRQPPINGINVLGEPKYNIDATVWHGDWSRPQNDGPALRAISMLHIANILLNQGQKEFVINHLFNKHLDFDKMGIIKTDLEYVANHWNFATAGLWEEVYSYHFFTEAVQRRALIYGAALAQEIGDDEAAYYYLQQAKYLEELMLTHWNEHRGYFAETIQFHDWKGGGLNSAIILSFLYGRIEVENDILSADNPKVISSAYHIRYAFEGLYRINIYNNYNNLGGPFLGRYPDDIYDGNGSVYGNPWVLTSAILAGYYYALAKKLLHKRKIEICALVWPFYNQVCPDLNLDMNAILSLDSEKERFLKIIFDLLTAGDNILKALKYYSITYTQYDFFHLSEQLNRYDGSSESAKDLTWGYSTLLSAHRARQLLVNELQKI